MTERERKAYSVYTQVEISVKYFLYYERKNFAYGCALDLHFIEPCGCLYKAQLCTNKHQTIINIIIQLDFVALKKKKNSTWRLFISGWESGQSGFLFINFFYFFCF